MNHHERNSYVANSYICFDTCPQNCGRLSAMVETDVSVYLNYLILSYSKT